MKFFLLVLSLLISDTFAFFWRTSNCESDSQCPTIRRKECAEYLSFPFSFICYDYKVTTISSGKCLDFYNGYLCTIFGGKNKTDFCRMVDYCHQKTGTELDNGVEYLSINLIVFRRILCWQLHSQKMFRVHQWQWLSSDCAWNRCKYNLV